MNQEEMSKKWNVLFKKVDKIKIDYVKERCPICKNKNLKHFMDCEHIEMDFDKFWERDNLVPICESCHIKTHESYIRLGNAQGAKILFKTRNYTGGFNG